MTNQELFKIYTSIDTRALQIAYLNGAIPGGLRRYHELEADLAELINSDISDAQIIAIATEGQLEQMQGMSGIFSKIFNGVKKVVKGVDKAGNNTVGRITKPAMGAAKSIARDALPGFREAEGLVNTGKNFASSLVPSGSSNIPSFRVSSSQQRSSAQVPHIRSITSSNLVFTRNGATSLPASTVLNSIKGVASQAFVYSMIPASSPHLPLNPTVAAKRSKSEAALRRMASAAGLDAVYLKKHIRNSIIEQFGVTPEEMLQRLSRGQRVDTTPPETIFSRLSALHQPLSSAGFRSSDIPGVGDFLRVATTPITNEPIEGSTVITDRDVRAGGPGMVITNKKESNAAATTSLVLSGMTVAGVVISKVA